jgi:hypothetical protein
MACPICVSPEGTAMTIGMRAGAIVLIVAAVIVVSLIARFAFRLWRLAADLSTVARSAKVEGADSAEESRA